MKHIIRNAAANVTTDWMSAPPGDYTLAGSATSLGGGTLKLQIGMPDPANPALTIAAADDPDLEVDPAASVAVIVTITSADVRFRGVLADATDPSGVNLWLL